MDNSLSKENRYISDIYIIERLGWSISLAEPGVPNEWVVRRNEGDVAVIGTFFHVAECFYELRWKAILRNWENIGEFPDEKIAFSQVSLLLELRESYPMRDIATLLSRGVDAQTARELIVNDVDSELLRQLAAEDNKV